MCTSEKVSNHEIVRQISFMISISQRLCAVRSYSLVQSFVEGAAREELDFKKALHGVPQDPPAVSGRESRLY